MKSYARGGGADNLRAILWRRDGGLYAADPRIFRVVAQALEVQRDTVAAIETLRGAPLMGCDILEIGPGQARFS